MINNPLITIVTVTHNLIESGRKEHFKQCLESVHNQTYNNIEHIVIDGSSTDGTIDLIKEYAEMGWIKYISEPDNGPYEAFNKGIVAANGKYIGFLNSDDYYHDCSGVEETVRALEKSKADFSYSSCIILSEISEKLNLYRANIHCAFTKTPFVHLSMFTKKDVLLKENLFDTKYKIASDYDLILKLLLKKNKYVFVPKVFATFRSGGISGDTALTTDDCTNVYYKNYSQFCNISISECKKMWENNTISIPLLLKFIKKMGLIFGLGMINYYFRKNFRKWLIQVRTKKGQETFKLFGIYLIKPKNGEV